MDGMEEMTTYYVNRFKVSKLQDSGIVRIEGADSAETNPEADVKIAMSAQSAIELRDVLIKLYPIEKGQKHELN